VLSQDNRQLMRARSHYEPEPCGPITIGVNPFEGASSWPVDVRVGDGEAGARVGDDVGAVGAVAVRVAVGAGADTVALWLGRGVAVAPIGRKVGAGALTLADVVVGTAVASPLPVIGTKGICGATTTAGGSVGRAVDEPPEGSMVVKPAPEPGAATLVVGNAVGCGTGVGSGTEVGGTEVGGSAGGNTATWLARVLVGWLVAVAAAADATRS
jgi:hypothetical protein